MQQGMMDMGRLTANVAKVALDEGATIAAFTVCLVGMGWLFCVILSQTHSTVLAMAATHQFSFKKDCMIVPQESGIFNSS
jgi:hypothetical protein